VRSTCTLHGWPVATRRNGARGEPPLEVEMIASHTSDPNHLDPSCREWRRSRTAYNNEGAHAQTRAAPPRREHMEHGEPLHWLDGRCCQSAASPRPTGRLLKAEGYVFDVAFTSVLKRAVHTLWIALDELDLMWIPVHHSWPERAPLVVGIASRGCQRPEPTGKFTRKLLHTGHACSGI
jgi:hypothetical protein